MKKHLLLFFILSKTVYSQTDSSTALVFFKETGVVIYLDDNKIEPQKELKPILVGKHTLKVWAPHYQLMEDTFNVIASENKFYTKKLRFSEDYKTYRRKQQAFKLTFIIPAIASIATAINYNSAYNNRNQKINASYDKALVLKNDYNNMYAGATADATASEYSTEKDNYNYLIKEQQQLKKQGIIISSTLLATAITFFIIDKVRKPKAFKEVPLLTHFIPSFNPLTNQVCVTIKL